MKTIDTLIDEYITWYLEGAVDNCWSYWFVGNEQVFSIHNHKVYLHENFYMNLYGMFESFLIGYRKDNSLPANNVVTKWLLDHKKIEFLIYWRNDDRSF